MKAGYYDRFARIRERRLRQQAGGKKLIFGEEEMLNHIRTNKVPAMMQHCILKVYKKTKGTDKEKFLGAYNICAAVFQNNGYMRKDDTMLTGKGIKNNRRHQQEKMAGYKKTKYRSLVQRIWSSSLRRIEKKEKGLK